MYLKIDGTHSGMVATVIETSKSGDPKIIEQKAYEFDRDMTALKMYATENKPYYVDILQDMIDRHQISQPVVSDMSFTSLEALSELKPVEPTPVDLTVGQSVWFPTHSGLKETVAACGSVVKLNDDGSANLRVTQMWDGDKTVSYKGVTTISPTDCYIKKTDCLEAVSVHNQIVQNYKPNGALHRFTKEEQDSLSPRTRLQSEVKVDLLAPIDSRKAILQNRPQNTRTGDLTLTDSDLSFANEQTSGITK